MKVDMVSAQNREAAGLMLAKKLRAYDQSNAIVVGISTSGVCVGASIAAYLSLPLEVIPCRRIADPSNNERTIGAVTAGEIIYHNLPHDIPQDYLAHQIILLRNAIAHEHHTYYDKRQPQSLQSRAVILVDDLLRAPEIASAMLREVKKQKPLKIIVAVPLVCPETARILEGQADEFHFLKMAPVSELGESCFTTLPIVDTGPVKMLLEDARGTMNQEKKTVKHPRRFATQPLTRGTCG